MDDYESTDVLEEYNRQIEALKQERKAIKEKMYILDEMQKDKVEEEHYRGKYVRKKDGTLQPFSNDKIIDAVKKSANRAMYEISREDADAIISFVQNQISITDTIDVEKLHIIVENALESVSPESAKAYREYRNYKTDFVSILDNVYKKSQSLRYIGDVSNANTDSTLIATQRSLTYGQLNKELYQKFFLNAEERQAINDGYIYIHDMKDRLDGINCCLCDMENILKGGFESANLWYTEPKTLDVAFDVISDVTMMMAAQQYG